MQFLFSWCGYGNGLSFKEIGESDLAYIETFVRNELKKRLLEKCEREKTQFDESEAEFFYGIYAGSIDEFKFLRGERIQILAIANILRDFLTEKGADEFKQKFEPPKNYKIGKDASRLSVGFFYGKKLKQAIMKKDLSPDELLLDLLPKLKRVFDKYNLKPFRKIDEEIIRIIALETGFRADVLCVFCPMNDCGIESLTKKHAIQYDKRGNWNLSNLNKHLKWHTTKATNTDASFEIHQPLPQSTPIKSSNDNNELSNNSQIQQSKSSEIETEIMSMPVEIEEDGEKATNEQKTIDMPSIISSYTGTIGTLYQQFSAQNLRLLEATLQNSETKKCMVLNVEDQFVNINVLNIKKDGNCMYGSLAHQLHCVKINSKEHIDLTAKLRKDVVNHIDNNFQQYTQALKFRLSNSNPEKAGKEFISTDLSKDGKWGGSETLLCVSNMFKVNILMFHERGPISFATVYNANFNRTVFIAYRYDSTDKDGSPIYNHYDSVCSIDERLLYKLANDLGSKMDKSDLVL